MKKMLSLLLALALVFSLAACGSTGAPTPAEPTAAPAEEEAAPVESLLGTQPVTITFWHCASDEAGVLMDKYIEEFNSTNEYGITVNAVYQGQYSDASTLLKAIISGGNFEELPDLMQLDATGKMTYYNSGKAFTVDQAVAAYAEPGCLDTYLSAALANWQFAGSQLGLPFATSTTVSYYNMDLLKEAGWDKVPETFDDVIRLYQDMQAKGLTQKVLQTVPNTPTLANWLGQLGSYVVNEKNGSEGTATELACLDNGALAAFLTQWKAMYDAGALINESGSADMFIAGDLVMMTNSSSNVAPVLEASWVFMQYLASAAVQADFAANTGYIPSNTAAMDEDIYKTVTAEYPQYLVAYDQLISTPADMRSVTVGPSKDFYYAIMQGVSDMLENDQTVEETVEIMSDEMQNLLTEYARNNAVA